MDGCGLKQYVKGRQFDGWLTDPTLAIKGQEYMLAVHARLACLNIPSLASRGRGLPASAKVCWHDRQTTTLMHISQFCQSTHGLRVNCHNAIVRMLASSLARQGLKTVQEGRLEAGNRRFLMCNLVCATKDRKKIFILDPIISSEYKELEEIAVHKAVKYRGAQ